MKPIHWLVLCISGAILWVWWSSRRTDAAAIADEKRRLADKAGQIQENMINSARPPLASWEGLVRALPDLIWRNHNITGGATAGAPSKRTGDSMGWTSGMIIN